MKLRSVISATGKRRGAILPFLTVLLLSIIPTSCESIYDDQSDCPRGVYLRFVYEYHMERGANAFPSNVDCVTVYVFDSEGNYVKQFSETSEALRSESYRMRLPLDAGSYDLLVYGGLACEERRFDITPGSPKRGEIRVTLPRNAEGASGIQLHDTENRTGGLFYGAVSVTLLEDGYREETVYMMKDTNNIQVILQEIDSPFKVDYADYEYRIIDDNFVLDSENKVVETATEDSEPYYVPYASENRIMGYVEYENRNGAMLEEVIEKPVQVACAEFSTSRLIIEHLPTAHLVITDRRTGTDIIDLPLIKYLTGIRGFGDSWIKSDQEFLDRQSRWTLMFFLQSGVWTNVRISVNWWTVRFNEAELG